MSWSKEAIVSIKKRPSMSFYDGTDFTIIEEPVLEKNNTGAGCTFASSISSQLVKGKSPLEAVKASKDFVFKRFNIQTSME